MWGRSSYCAYGFINAGPRDVSCSLLWHHDDASRWAAAIKSWLPRSVPAICPFSNWWLHLVADLYNLHQLFLSICYVCPPHLSCHTRRLSPNTTLRKNKTKKHVITPNTFLAWNSRMTYVYYTCINICIYIYIYQHTHMFICKYIRTYQYKSMLGWLALADWLRTAAASGWYFVLVLLCLVCPARQ